MRSEGFYINESSVIARFYRGNLQSKYSFRYSELSRHCRGSIHSKYNELIQGVQLKSGPLTKP